MRRLEPEDNPAHPFVTSRKSAASLRMSRRQAVERMTRTKTKGVTKCLKLP